jgi:hypothetical protein
MCSSWKCTYGTCATPNNGGACEGDSDCTSGICSDDVCTCIAKNDDAASPNQCCSGSWTRNVNDCDDFGICSYCCN